MKRIPAFVISGMLDAGKSSFILDTIENDRFFERGTTLLLVQEQGEIEYDEELLKKFRCSVLYVEEESDWDLSQLNKKIEAIHPDRVVVETNGMWNHAEMEYPSILSVKEQILLIDWTTFPMYFQNMRQKMVDLISGKDVVVFNRLEDNTLLAPYQTNIKMVNSTAQYVMIGKDGYAMEAFQAPLPYDYEADTIEVKQDDFATFYIDTFDHPDRYKGKEVILTAWAIRPPKDEGPNFIIGRKVMTCCSNDIQLFGYYVKNPDKTIINDHYYRIKGKIAFEFSEEYKEEELVIYLQEAEEVPAFAEPILNLNPVA